MGNMQTFYRGALLGMAVGDAMGNTVDNKTLTEICEDYGPNGLLGYDLVNGYADVTSYTQVASFCANGLLLGMTRGQMQGKMAPLVRYVNLALREWSRSQHYSAPERTFCWLSGQPELAGGVSNHGFLNLRMGIYFMFDLGGAVGAVQIFDDVYLLCHGHPP